jgi:hypothetical protein
MATNPDTGAVMINPATGQTPEAKASPAKIVDVDEKTDRKSSDTPDVAEGELVDNDKDGNVDVIREKDYTEAEYEKLLRKIDRYLLPSMWFCYGIQQTDKIAIGTQAIFGLVEDTNLVGQQYSWLTI